MTPFELVKADLFRHTGKYSITLLLKNLLNNNRSFKYTFWLRLCNSNNFLIKSIAWYMHRHLSIKCQIQIPKETQIGPGLYLGHASSVMMNSTVVIGKNCNLSQFTTIGSNHGKGAIIGDNVYIGPNVCIVEAVTIGDCVTIGAGTIVVKNVSNNSTVVGNPARVICDHSIDRYINNPCKIETQ
ncbi:serine acetyltransferase [Psychromonas sp. Urea-02u-13]|uniref:serine acetyltransferase n=1 Tax=Psychromonas sp. Urea-02u-13 TaxID=2058326 RepID=UPI0018E30119|nr:serine acetyltransferase [Psychromonas sp. Urea-02u-13]